MKFWSFVSCLLFVPRLKNYCVYVYCFNNAYLATTTILSSTLDDFNLLTYFLIIFFCHSIELAFLQEFSVLYYVVLCSSSMLRNNPARAHMELLWHPDVVHIYLPLLSDCTNPETLEAAVGAVQNLAACHWQVMEAYSFDVHQTVFPKICSNFTINFDSWSHDHYIS